VIFDRPIPNDEVTIRSLVGDASEHGPVVLVVDQPSSMSNRIPAGVVAPGDATPESITPISRSRLRTMWPTAPTNIGTAVTRASGADGVSVDDSKHLFD
jgi:hypothetical protein